MDKGIVEYRCRFTVLFLKMFANERHEVHSSLYNQKSTLAVDQEDRDPMQRNISFFPILHNAVSPQLRLRNFH